MAETGYAIATLADLKAIDSSIRSLGYTRLVIETSAWYIFIDTATNPTDNINIITPNVGSGRWFRTKSYTLSSDIADLQEYIQDQFAALFSSDDLQGIYDDPNNILTINFRPEIIENSDISPTAAIAQSKIANLVTTLNNKADSSHVHSSASITDFVIATLNAVAANYSSPTNTANITYNSSTQELEISSSLNVSLEGQNTVTGNSLNFTGPGVSVSAANNIVTVDIVPVDPLVSTVVDTSYALTTPSQDAGTSAQYTLTLPATVLIREIVCNFPSRIRMYPNETYATDDNARLITLDPTGDHGCMLEVSNTVNNYAVNCIPPVYVYKEPTRSTVVVVVDNLDTVARSFVINFKTYKW